MILDNHEPAFFAGYECGFGVDEATTSGGCVGLVWIGLHTRVVMYTSAVTQAEVITGIALLPAGKRRTLLLKAASQIFEVDFKGQCLHFDSVAAKNYAVILTARTLQGRPISTEDAQIAAVAQAAGLTVATRNTKDIEWIENLLIANPWEVLPFIAN